MKQTSHPFISANGAALGDAIGPAYESHVEAVINTVRTNSVGAALRRTIQTAWVIVP